MFLAELGQIDYKRGGGRIGAVRAGKEGKINTYTSDSILLLWSSSKGGFYPLFSFTRARTGIKGDGLLLWVKQKRVGRHCFRNVQNCRARNETIFCCCFV